MISLKTTLRHLWQLRDSEIVWTIKVLAFLLLAFGIVGTMDYADEKAMEAQMHQVARQDVENAFLRCLNGKPTAQTDKAVIVCQKPWEVLK